MHAAAHCQTFLLYLATKEHIMETACTKVTQIIGRKDGSEVRIVAQAFFGQGLHKSIWVYVHCRKNSDSGWRLCDDRPHPDWRTMSVEDYQRYGRSEMLQAVSPIEILKLTSMLA